MTSLFLARTNGAQCFYPDELKLGREVEILLDVQTKVPPDYHVPYCWSEGGM